MKKHKKIYLFLFSLIAVGVIGVLPALAADSLVNNKAAGYATGDYKLEYIREYAIYIAQIILGLVGSASLLAFVIGGVMFLISGGSKEKIKKGTDIIKAAVIGLLITFSSVLIINTLLNKGLKVNWNSKTGEIPTTGTTQQ
jgi:hypothetical protein